MPDDLVLVRKTLQSQPETVIAGRNETIQQDNPGPQTEGKAVDSSDCDLFLDNNVDKYSLILRGGDLAAKPAEEPAAKPAEEPAAKPAERPQNPSTQSRFTMSVEGNTLRNGSMLIVGPGADLKSVLEARIEMAKLRKEEMARK
ncbi:unnamed protein product [Clonostachys byssicola]|uniref:Uncharacterized protein n=1 Tax=Clonostachys byssicola TaxID=160290 RepID=A0A9N9Y144_9HYPO|nr:unnamed protein product [Clonostachys byssicola]